MQRVGVVRKILADAGCVAAELDEHCMGDAA